MSAKQFKIECTLDNAPKFAEWIKTRKGVASWQSINLSNREASWSTPATKPDGVTPMDKPIWQAADVPTIVTDPADIGVFTEALFKAFPVGLRRGSQGFSFKLTDGAQRKLDRAMEQCEEKHGSAHYKIGVLDIDGASMGVYYTTGTISLADWIAQNQSAPST